MVEYRIEHRGLVGFENMNFAIDITKLTKAAKNRSYPNLSPCHQTPLVQKKFCGTCDKEVDTKEVTHKAFKLGKEMYPVSAEHLKKIKATLDSDTVTITEFRGKNEIPEMYFTDVIFGAKQHKKYMKDYVEYSQILTQTGKVAIGTMNYRERPYPIMIVPYQNNLVIRALHFYEEVDSLPAINAEVPANTQKVNLLVQAMQLSGKSDPFDITQFVNVREEKEQELIEKVLKGEAIPNVEKVQVETKEDNDEIARLQELLAKNKATTTEAKNEDSGVPTLQ